MSLAATLLFLPLSLALHKLPTGKKEVSVSQDLKEHGTIRKIHAGGEGFVEEATIHEGEVVILCSAHDLHFSSLKTKLQTSQLDLYQLEEFLSEIVTPSPLEGASTPTPTPLPILESILPLYDDSCDTRRTIDDSSVAEGQEELVRSIRNLSYCDDVDDVDGSASGSAWMGHGKRKLCIFISSFHLKSVAKNSLVYLPSSAEARAEDNKAKESSGRFPPALRSVITPSSSVDSQFVYMPIVMRVEDVGEGGYKIKVFDEITT